MTAQELLRPRFEVIATYPKSIFKMGEIINTGHDTIYCDPKGEKYTDFPHLFKKLNWWDKRRIEDMPIYIKSDTQVVKPDWKMEEWNDRNYLRAYDPESAKYNLIVSFNLELFKPATEVEYLSFINKA